MATVEALPSQTAAAEQDLPFLPGLCDRTLELGHGLGVDDGAEEDVALRGITDLQGSGAFQ